MGITSRRRLLAATCAVGIPLSAGCLGDDGGPIVDSSFLIVEQGCERRSHDGSIRVDDTTVALTGTVAARETCGTPRMLPYVNESDPREVVVDLEYSRTTPCGECDRYYEYDGSLTLRQPPSKVKLFHSAGYDGLETIDIHFESEQQKNPSTG